MIKITKTKIPIPRVTSSTYSLSFIIVSYDTKIIKELTIVTNVFMLNLLDKWKEILKITRGTNNL